MYGTFWEERSLQRTLSAPLSFQGTGLHSGRAVCVTVQPAPEDHGLVFSRSDLDGAPEIRAHIDHVVRTNLATTLGVDDASVSTVEHLIAALSGLGIDNARVAVDGPELPGMDGSALPYVRGILDAGIEELAAPRRFLRVDRVVEARDPDTGRWSRLSPLDGFAIDCEISFDHPMLKQQNIQFAGDGEHFASEIAPARTFGMLADVERMRAAGLALGGGLDNAVVFSATGVINPGGLRFPDECVRHKVLDMIGDLALLGAPLLGHFSACRSGHAFNLALVRKALDEGALRAEPARSLSASG